MLRPFWEASHVKNLSAELGVQSFCFRGSETNEQVIECVKAVGLSNIEICQKHIKFADESVFEDAIATYKAAGVGILSIGVQQIRGDVETEESYFKFAQMAGCTWCHTPVNATQQAIPEQLLAGGHEFVLPNGKVVRATNISSDKEFGIGNWTEELFIARFRQYQGEAGQTIPVGDEGNNTLMSWTLFAGMTDEDLAAMYAYLMASEARGNPVIVWD